MIKRPKNTDSEQDLLEMQMQFMKEKEKNAKFQPAAQVVRAAKIEKKQSEFSKRRGLNPQDKDPKPSTSNIVLGDIVERCEPMDFEVSAPVSSPNPFPKVEKVDIDTVAPEGISLFAHMRAMGQSIQYPQKPIELGSKSYIVQGSVGEEIHRQNVDMLAGVSPEEIQEERQKLLQTIDPSVLDFLKKIRAEKVKRSIPQQESITTPMTSEPSSDVSELAKVAQENKWVNFDEIEGHKLEWMKDVSVDVPLPKDGESYEARFDWKGTLLPFSETSTSDNRELYLHGDDPHRPGYTLQELFRLARSDVLQQRVSALTSIQGILAIYNQGFYDQVLELPVSKIFFLLRFSLDDKAPAVIEQALLGLANLFYNNSDEFLLDCIFDTKLGREEPAFQDAKHQMQIANSFKKLSVSGTYQTPLQDDEEAMLNEDANLNDFHLAETDLVKCLLRTNIIERIQYLVNVMKSESGSRIKESSVRILIRIARYGQEGIEKITENHHLMDGLIDSVLEEKEEPRTTGLIIKLLRMIISYSIVPDLNVPVVMELANKIIFSRDNLNAPYIRLQVEAFRLLRVILKDRRYQDAYNDFVPAIRYLFEWHYQFLDIRDSRSAVVHQHMTAMIAMLCHPLYCYDRNICSEVMVLCFRKWLTIFTSWLESAESVEFGFSQNILLSVIIEFCTENKWLYQAVKDLIRKLITSAGFQDKILVLLCTDTSIRKIAADRREILKQLPNFGSVSFDRHQKVSLILPQSSPVIIANATLRLLTKCDRELLKQLKSEPFTDFLVQFTTYPKNVAIMKQNWFCRHDLELIFSIVQAGICKDIALVLKVTGQFVSCLKARSQIEHLLQDIFFNPAMYANKLGYSEGEILLWKDVYMQYYLMRQSTMETPEDSLMPVNWPYAILDIFYEQHMESKDKRRISFNIEKETEDRLIRVSMGMTTLLEANGVFLVSPTEQFFHLMMAFLSPECRFLDATVKECLLQRALFLKESIYTNGPLQLKGDTFDFASFYTVLLNQFQSAGYADKLFSALILVPLSTQYDIKWRKMVWSEHVAVLRFISCAKEELIFSDFSAFIKKRSGLEDENYDISLLKSYNLAINMKQLKQDSVPWKIAEFYLANK